jgi:hypothetical protein
MPNIFIQQMHINLKGGIELSSQPGPFVFLFSSFFLGVVVMPKGPCNGIFGGLLSLLSRPGPDGLLLSGEERERPCGAGEGGGIGGRGD